MPTQVQNRPSSAEPLPPSRTSVERHTSMPLPDPTHHPSHDPRAKYNQHREALRIALGSILTPKRPPMPGSRSSSGTASPAYSFSGSSGSYTPATPPSMPYTPSLDANGQEHPYSRGHYPHQHYHPIHPPSKLGRMESYHDAPEGDISASVSPSSSPPKHSSTPFSQPLLVRSRSQTPSSRTSPRIQPTTPPIPHTPPTFTTADYPDLGPSYTSSSPMAVTNHDDGGKFNGGQMTQSMSTSGDSSGSSATATQGVGTCMDGSGNQSQHQQQQNGRGSGSSSSNGAGTPKAKFIQTLKGKSAWDALIHGSFS